MPSAAAADRSGCEAPTGGLGELHADIVGVREEMLIGVVSHDDRMVAHPLLNALGLGTLVDP